MRCLKASTALNAYLTDWPGLAQVIEYRQVRKNMLTGEETHKAQYGITSLSPEEASAERVAVMNNGTIEQIGTPEDVYRQPKTVYVANFLGKTNIIETDIRGGVAKTPFGVLEIDSPNATGVLLSIRPEHFTIEKHVSNSNDRNSGRIVAREFKGHDFTYCVEVDGKPYFVQTDYQQHLQVGEAVILKPNEAVVIENID